ncbi:sugar transporter SWEET1 [Epargyreus clarus]|uniref:sugar transporter SWEET1 n=1 Tax=Epargyreus clarus TaxID=520877 RepID=UPI003C2E7ED0
MNLVDFKEFISYLAILSNILQFLSGILVCKQYVIKKTTGEATALPFIFGVLSCNLWLLYGLAKPDNIIVFVNTIGISMMISYVIVFYIFTLKKSHVLREILITVTTSLFIIGYFCVEDDNELLLRRLGLSACSITLLMIAAPMSKLYYVIQTKCTDCLPFPMIVMSFFVSVFWFLYGVIEEDLYISVPNFIGGLLATAQLAVFVVIPSKSYKRLPSKSILA